MQGIDKNLYDFDIRITLQYEEKHYFISVDHS